MKPAPLDRVLPFYLVVFIGYSLMISVSLAVGPEEQGSALGANQSLQVGAEGLSGLAGGGLAAISTALPLPAMGALALVGSGLLMRPGAKAAVGEPSG